MLSCLDTFSKRTCSCAFTWLSVAEKDLLCLRFGIEVVFADKLEYIRTRAFMKLWVVGVEL